MKKFSVVIFVCFALSFLTANGQCLNDYPKGTNVSMSALTFTNGGSGCTPPTSTGTYTENVNIGNTSTANKQMGNGDIVTMITFTLNGNLTVYANGNSTLYIPAGVTVTINGNLIDASNNVTFDVQGTLIVTGTLQSNNNTVFSDGTGSGQTGTISVGTLNLGNNASCDATVGCPHISATTCLPAGSAFCTSGAVPIKLSSFTGQQEGESIQLLWATASELNFDYFSLQKSSNGKDFSEFAQVRGHGTTNEAHNYSYEDTDPFVGRSYYRLTSNDFDGYQETFKVVSVEYHGGKNFHIYSNPSDGTSIKLHFNFEADPDGTVTIYDNVGALVGTYHAGESISFDTPLKNGIYLAKYSSSTLNKTDRFVVK